MTHCHSLMRDVTHVETESPDDQPQQKNQMPELPPGTLAPHPRESMLMHHQLVHDAGEPPRALCWAVCDVSQGTSIPAPGIPAELHPDSAHILGGADGPPGSVRHQAHQQSGTLPVASGCALLTVFPKKSTFDDLDALEKSLLAYFQDGTPAHSPAHNVSAKKPKGLVRFRLNSATLTCMCIPGQQRGSFQANLQLAHLRWVHLHRGMLVFEHADPKGGRLRLSAGHRAGCLPLLPQFVHSRCDRCITHSKRTKRCHRLCCAIATA